MIVRVMQILFVILILGTAVVIVKDYVKNKEEDVPVVQKVLFYIIGMVLDFFDSLGIGCYAPATAVYGMFKLVDDKKIPGTLNAGVAIPAALQGLLFITAIQVEIKTLVLVVAAGVLGTFLGSKMVAKASTKTVTLVMSIALFIAALLMLGSKLGVLPSGGEAVGLEGMKLVIACVGNFVIGVALCFGVGNFAPCMCMIYLLGMSPLVAYPIMMSSSGFGCAAAGIQSIKEGLINRHAVMGFTVGACIGVIIAVKVVKSMPISILQWLVIIVVIYSAIMMFRRAMKYRKAEI